MSWMHTITSSATHLMGIINDILTLRAARSGMQVRQELVRGGAGGWRLRADGCWVAWQCIRGCVLLERLRSGV